MEDSKQNSQAEEEKQEEEQEEPLQTFFPPSPPEEYSPPPPPARPPKRWDWGELEAKAAVWGTRIGAFIVVVGLGYLLSIGFSRLDMFGKVMAVYAACAAMWGAGVVFERNERYTAWARTMIAAGWAGVYITTYLINVLEEARLITDPSIGTFLLMGIAAGMIVHSLKYRSQTLTTLTYLIAFATIALSINLADQRVFSLVAIAVLAVSMLFILHRTQWHWLAVFCMAGCYGAHAIWLYPLTSTFWAPGGQDVEFWLGLSMLVLYWLTFTAAALLTRPVDSEREAISLWITAVNFALFVAVFRYQVGSEYQDLRWLFFGGLAAAYIVLSYLSYLLNRQSLLTLNLVIAVLSTTMALYYGLLGGNWVAVGWLLQAEALYVAGLLSRQKRFRWIAVANFVLVGCWLLARDFFVTDELTLFGFTFYKRTLIFATTAVVFYVNAFFRHTLAHKIKETKTPYYLFSYAASILWLIIMLRNWYPDDLLKGAVAGAFLGLALMEIGIRIRDYHFRIQGLFFSTLGIITALVPLVLPGELYYIENVRYRIGCEAAVIVLTYTAFARFQRRVLADEHTSPFEMAVAVSSEVAVVIAALFLYREFKPEAPVWLALAWMVLGVVLIELGIALRNPFLRIQGYLVAGLTLLWTLYSFMTQPEWLGDPLNHLLSMGLVILGFYYLFARILTGSGKEASAFSETERAEVWGGNGRFLPALFSVAGTLILVLLLRHELIGAWPLFVAVAWLAAAVVLVEVGLVIRNPVLRVQGYLATGLALLWVLGAFSAQPGWFDAPPHHLLILGLVIVGFYYLFARILTGSRKETSALSDPERAEVWSGNGSLLAGFFSFAGTLVLILLLHHELIEIRPLFIAVAWLAAAVVLLEVSIAVGSRPLRLQTMGIAGLAFICALFLNLTPGESIGPLSERLITLLLCIGCLYYIHERLFAGQREDAEWADLPDFTPVFSWLAAILVVLVIGLEVWTRWPAWVGTAWIVPMVASVLIGLRRRCPHFLIQSLLLSILIFLWTLFRTIPALASPDIAAQIEAHRIFAVIPIIAVFYAIFLIMLKHLAALPEEQRPDYLAHATDLASWWASILLIALITVEMPDAYRALTAVVWIGLAIGLLEAGQGLNAKALRSQGFLLAVAAFLRAMFINLGSSYGTFLSMSGRTASVLFVALALYYLWLRLTRSKEETVIGIPEKNLGSAMSYLATASLALLLWTEVHPNAWLPPAWAGLMLLVMVAGIALRDRNLIYQSLILVVPVVIGVLVLDFPEHGTDLCRKASGLAIGALFVARIIWQVGFYAYKNRSVEDGRQSGFLARGTRHIFSLPAAALLAILIPLELSGELTMYLTLAWACEGLLLMVLGFTLNDRVLRLTGLGLMAFCILKVFRDLWVLQIDRIYKVIALIGLGVILIITGWIYASYREQIVKRFIEE